MLNSSELSLELVKNSLKQQKNRLRTALPGRFKKIKQPTILLDLVAGIIYGGSYIEVISHCKKGNIDLKRFYPALLENEATPQLIEKVKKKLPAYAVNMQRLFANKINAEQCLKIIVQMLGLQEYISENNLSMHPIINIGDWRAVGPKEYPDVLLEAEGCLDGRLAKFKALRVFSEELHYPAEKSQSLEDEIDLRIAWLPKEYYASFLNNFNKDEWWESMSPNESSDDYYPRPPKFTKEMVNIETSWENIICQLQDDGFSTTVIDGSHYILSGTLTDEASNQFSSTVNFTQDLFLQYEDDPISECQFSLSQKNTVITRLMLNAIPLRLLEHEENKDSKHAKLSFDEYYRDAKPYIKDWSGKHFFYFSNLTYYAIDTTPKVSTSNLKKDKDSILHINTEEPDLAYQMLKAIYNKKGVYRYQQRRFFIPSEAGIGGSNKLNDPLHYALNSILLQTTTNNGGFGTHSISVGLYCEEGLPLFLEVLSVLEEVIRVLKIKKTDVFLKKLVLFGLSHALPKDFVFPKISFYETPDYLLEGLPTLPPELANLIK